MTLAIAHAGGALRGEAYTNSLEAMDAAYARGFRWFEMDFLRTADGAVACRHDWKGWPSVPSLAELRARFAGRFTPADAESLAAWMAAREDATLVTDVKEADQLPVLRDLLAAGLPSGRTVVQLFQPEEDEPVASLGFPRRSIILYRYEGGTDRLTRFVEQARPAALGVSLAQVRTGLLDRLPPVSAWVYTVNEAGKAQRLAARGVEGVFTDTLNPGEAGLVPERRHRLFAYGTLCDGAVQERVFGRDLPGEPDAIEGWEKGLFACRDGNGLAHYPVVSRAEGRRVEGQLLRLTDEQFSAADEYEGADYARLRVRLASGRAAWLYVAA